MGGGSGVKDHPPPMARPPVPRVIFYDADHDAVGEHVVIVIAPLADGREAEAR
jgi:hypothetical protein